MFYERDKQVITMFNKCGEVLGTSDISCRFTLNEISEFTHFKMAHASCWTFRLSLLLGDRFSKEENK